MRTTRTRRRAPPPPPPLLRRVPEGVARGEPGKTDSGLRHERLGELHDARGRHADLKAVLAGVTRARHEALHARHLQLPEVPEEHRVQVEAAHQRLQRRRRRGTLQGTQRGSSSAPPFGAHSAVQLARRPARPTYLQGDEAALIVHVGRHAAPGGVERLEVLVDVRQVLLPAARVEHDVQVVLRNLQGVDVDVDAGSPQPGVGQLAPCRRLRDARASAHLGDDGVVDDAAALVGDH
eukprot:scaffold7215_cov366-Prasinococcus_capsulatus_cf.AAC.29